MIEILFIEDEVETQKVIKMILPEDYIVNACTTGLRGLQQLSCRHPDVVLLDLGLPDMDGIAVLKSILERPNPPPVIILTCCSNIPTVVLAMKLGAADYLVKPYTRTLLLESIRNAVLRHCRADSGKSVSSTENPLLDKLIGTSPTIQYIKNLMVRYAERSAPVLITGESGTGKDLVASIIHQLSARRKNPFLALNCASIPDTLIETELFGSEEGAFTGAVSKPGKIECADGGTLFLDEIGDMALRVQAKLLRCLENQIISRVGGIKETHVDARIIAATNKNLESLIEEGLFRQDLYYRLHILPMNIPPLRDRTEDLPLLVEFFLQEHEEEAEKMSAGALEKLLQHPWPGNIRELKSVIERAIVHAGSGVIERIHILF